MKEVTGSTKQQQKNPLQHCYLYKSLNFFILLQEVFEFSTSFNVGHYKIHVSTQLTEPTSGITSSLLRQCPLNPEFVASTPVVLLNSNLGDSIPV
jgi:hypothetical protein